MNEDLAPFFADFAATAQVGGVNVRAIFDNGHAGGDVGALGMSGRAASLTLPTAQLPASPVGLLVVVAAKRYTVAEHQPDGTGVSVLMLEAA